MRADDATKAAPFARYAEIRAVLEVETAATLWGQESTIVPAVCPVGFGDQGQLLVLSPTMQRPNRYVVAIDSQWDERCGSDNEKRDLYGDVFHDHSEDIQQALIDAFGEHSDDIDHPDLSECGCEWPVGIWEGCGWGLMDWPVQS